MPKNKLIYGAIILFAANLFNRILAFVYQYLIMRHIGSEAYGLFITVFPVYMTALVLTTAGIPLAISILIAEKVSLGRYGDAHKVFRIALLILFITAIIVSLILFFNTTFIVNRFFTDQRVFIVFKICIPAVFIVSIASAFRGYFQGLQNMMPSALSQVCEQIFRIAVGFSLAIKLLDKGIEWAAAGLAAGMLCGEIVGFAVILIQYHSQRKQRLLNNISGETSKSILRKLITLSLPVTGSRLMSTGLSALDAFLIPRQLQIAGYTARNATSLFGQLGGTAMTLLTFPSVFTYALSVSLVPAISEAVVRKDYTLAQSRCSDAIKYTLILGLPFVIVLYFFAEPLTLLFKSESVSSVLRVLALGGIFIYLQQTTTGILQGLGKTLLPLVHSSITALFRIPLLFYLTGMPQWGLVGTSVAYVFGYFSMAILNLNAIKRNIGLKMSYQIFLQPLTAGLVMLAVIKVITNFAPNNLIICLYSTILGLVLYLSILLLNGGIHIKDLRKVPLINKLLP